MKVKNEKLYTITETEKSLKLTINYKLLADTEKSTTLYKTIDTLGFKVIKATKIDDAKLQEIIEKYDKVAWEDVDNNISFESKEFQRWNLY